MKTIIKGLSEQPKKVSNLVNEVKKDSKKFTFLKKHSSVHDELDEQLFWSKLHTKEEIKEESVEPMEDHEMLALALFELSLLPGRQ